MNNVVGVGCVLSVGWVHFDGGVYCEGTCGEVRGVAYTVGMLEGSGMNTGRCSRGGGMQNVELRRGMGRE
jgi:hypothetical protein